MKKNTKVNEAGKYFVYILRTNKNTLYTGQTKDLSRRLEEHREKKGKASKYIRAFESVRLVYFETVGNLSEALKREAIIKKLTKMQKEKLVEGFEKNK